METTQPAIDRLTEQPPATARVPRWLAPLGVGLLLAAGFALMAALWAPDIVLRNRADEAYATMPPVDFAPPDDRARRLPRVFETLQRGGTLRVVMLGDSIVKDASRSAWEQILMRENPRVKIVKFTSIANATGCGFYKLPGNVERLVLRHRPDLVIIGGISNGEAANVREVVSQIQAASKTEILLLTGPFGDGPDPTRGKDWRASRPQDGEYAQRLAAVADETGAGFVDLQAAWGDYVFRAGKPLGFWKRDGIHSSAAGEQIMGRILVRYFTP